MDQSLDIIATNLLERLCGFHSPSKQMSSWYLYLWFALWICALSAQKGKVCHSINLFYNVFNLQYSMHTNAGTQSVLQAWTLMEESNAPPIKSG